MGIFWTLFVYYYVLYRHSLSVRRIAARTHIIAGSGVFTGGPGIPTGTRPKKKKKDKNKRSCNYAI